MSAVSLQITYRKGKPIAAYLYLARTPGQTSARSVELASGLVVDYAPDGAPIGIEIVSPASVTIDEINSAFDGLGIGRPAPADLAPLRAA
jgi:hypothetical protein